MTEQPIFELFRDDEKPSREFVKIFVNFNGERKSLLEVTEVLEKGIFDTDLKVRKYNWRTASFLYEMLLDAREKRTKYAMILKNGIRNFLVTVTETKDQVIWSRVMRSRPLAEDETDIFEGIEYPDFVFDKKQYDEEMEKLRVVFEQKKKLEEEHNKKLRVARVRNYFWNKETLNNSTIDYSSLAHPKQYGPIFEVFDSGNKYADCECVKIFVELDGQRRSLVDVLKEWETPFDDEIAGGYTWLPLVCLYEELIVKMQQRPFFREILMCGACGLPGPCWPFRVQVHETEDLVIWTNFRQPHRNKYSLGGFWDYSQYPPFVFDKQQYYSELAAMRPAYDQYMAKQEEMEQNKHEVENTEIPWW